MNKNQTLRHEQRLSYAKRLLIKALPHLAWKSNISRVTDFLLTGVVPPDSPTDERYVWNRLDHIVELFLDPLHDVSKCTNTCQCTGRTILKIETQMNTLKTYIRKHKL